ncbi:MAG: AbrB/MazE/SpoVT family DNA-binding domain-containing protein [Dehalococcoidia bacterium]|nr:AbrB/MazE/SpoVT family DNA-binding domain-containing protein [Dehalococcoidia bacterium]
MQELLTVVTRKGQVTIPAELRRTLNLRQGDMVAFVVESDGTIRLTVPRYPTIASLRGAAGALERPLSWEETMSIAREDALQDKHDKGR